MKRKIINRIRYYSTLSFKKAILKSLVAFVPNKTKRRELLIKYDLRPTPTHYGDKFIYSGDDANEIIFKILANPEPCLIARQGSSELSVMGFAFAHINKSKIIFPKKVKNRMCFCAGFFPNSDELLTKYAIEALHIISNIDVFSVWRFKDMDERDILDTYGKQAKLIRLEDISNSIFFANNSWIESLSGKKVLAINSFADLFITQYANKDKLFGRQILPDFDLKIIKSVQGIGGKDSNKFKDWFEALKSMYQQIDNTDFDIALIGAGAFSLHLGNYIKNKGKKAVILGRQVPYLFGVVGSHSCPNLPNEYWVHVPQSDIPSREGIALFAKYEGDNSYF